LLKDLKKEICGFETKKFSPEPLKCISTFDILSSIFQKGGPKKLMLYYGNPANKNIDHRQQSKTQGIHYINNRSIKL